MELNLPKNVYSYDKSNHDFYLKNFRKIVCTDFIMKNCPFDSKSCFYSHSLKPQRRVGNLDKNYGIFYKSEACEKMLKQQICEKDVECDCAHSQFEIDYHPDFFKTRECASPLSSKNGFCAKYGLHCPNAHGDNDLRIFSIKTENQGETKTFSVKIAETKNKFDFSSPPKDTIGFLKWYKTNQCDFEIDKCPRKNTCGGYHCQKERRRDPLKINYKVEKCVFGWTDENNIKCPAKDKCPFSHTDNETIYHPRVYKMIMCKTFMSSRPFGGDLSLKDCKKGKLCERAHGNEDLRPGRNDHQKFNSVEKSFFKQAKEEIGEGDNRSGKKLNLDSIDFLNVDFDLSNIPEEGEGESVEIAKMRKELESVTSKCKELTESYKKNYYDIVDAVTKRIEKETKEMRLSCKEEVRYLEKLAKKRLEEMDDLRFRLKCPLCHNRNRNAVLDPCGHLFCAQCYQKTNIKECFYCGLKCNSIILIKSKN